VDNPVNHLPVITPPSAPSTAERQKRPQPFPFGIRQITPPHARNNERDRPKPHDRPDRLQASRHQLHHVRLSRLVVDDEVVEPMHPAGGGHGPGRILESARIGDESRGGGRFPAGFVIMSGVRPSRRDLEAVIAQLRGEFRRRRREVEQLRVENEILREAAEVRRTEREFDGRELTQRIVEIHTAHPAYGAERVTRELERQGIEVGRRGVTPGDAG
jgi:hypothetical protein